MKKQNKIWNRIKSAKAVLSAAVMTLMFGCTAVTAHADVLSALTNAKNKAQTSVITLFQNVVAPLLGTAAAVVLVFNIFKLIKHKRDGEDYGPNIITIVITAIIAVLFFAFSAWGNALFK